MKQTENRLFSSAVLDQKTMIPEIYGSVDFDHLPERYVTDFDIEALRPSRHRSCDVGKGGVLRYQSL